MAWIGSNALICLVQTPLLPGSHDIAGSSDLSLQYRSDSSLCDISPGSGSSEEEEDDQDDLNDLSPQLRAQFDKFVQRGRSVSLSAI